jgi:hypothetical protein
MHSVGAYIQKRCSEPLRQPIFGESRESDDRCNDGNETAWNDDSGSSSRDFGRPNPDVARHVEDMQSAREWSTPGRRGATLRSAAVTCENGPTGNSGHDATELADGRRGMRQ